MLYKKYGNTGKTLSSVGFGGMRFDISKSNEENAELLLYAQSKGINYFDTAPDYCNDKSEDIFGLALKKMPKGNYVSTKGMPAKFDTAQKAADAVKRSIERLKVDKINFYYVWCVRKMENYQLAMKPGGQYEGLLRCKEEGLIEHIVFSSHQTGYGAAQILSEGKMEGVLMGINILNFRYRQEGIKKAFESGYGVVAMNPLGGGLIPKHQKQLSFLSDGKESPVDAALRFVISLPQIASAIVGFSNKQQIDQAVEIAEKATEFSEEELKRIMENISAGMNLACTGCGYCRDCPEDIPVASYMQFYNDKQVFGANDNEMMKKIGFEHGWNRLAQTKSRASACIECGSCEEACTQHIPIISRLKEIADWESKLI